jgi:release factor glutamine methyltransferase
MPRFQGSEKNKGPGSAWFQGLEKRLEATGNANPKRSAEELAAHVLGCKPLEIYFREITPEQQAELETLIARAESGEPIQYIIGHVDFRGLEIACDPRALIPRPETELLVEAVLENVDATSSSRYIRKERGGDTASTIRIADVCTGTGCIGLALAHELPNAKITATDISPEALALAKENAERLGLSDRIEFVQGDLFNVDATSSSRCPGKERGEDTASTLFAENSFDVVVSNPPYIFSKVWKKLEPCVRDREPQLALDGGEDGMDLIRPLVEQAARVLKPGGGLFLEIGYDQGEAVAKCLRAACPQQRATRETCAANGGKAAFKYIRILKDLAGHDRIVAGFKG